MRRIGLAIAIITVSALPAYSLDHVFEGLGWPAIVVNGETQRVTVESCQAKREELDRAIDSIIGGIGPAEQAANQDLRNRDRRQCQFGEQNVFEYLRLTDTARFSFAEQCIADAQGFQRPAHDAAQRLAEMAKSGNVSWLRDCEERARSYVLQQEEAERARRVAEQQAMLASGNIPNQHFADRRHTSGAQQQPPAVPSGGAGGSLAQTQAAEAQQQPPQVPSGGAGGSLAEAQGAQAQPAAVSSGGAGGSEAVVWGAQPAFDWKLGPEPSAVPNSGGAGGSLAETQGAQAASPTDGGGAGGSERTRTASVSPTTQTQKDCDQKSFGDAQPALLSQPKAKTEPKKRDKRVRAPTDADIARSNSGMSPEAANAIGTIIGVGLGVGLNNIGHRGTSGAAPYRGSSAAAPRRGTFDGPLR